MPDHAADSATEGGGPLILIVTGMSGAGKSTTLKALEDLGWEAVDNLPLSLLPTLLAAPVERPLALGLDTRTRAFDAEAVAERVREERAAGRRIHILFLECAGDQLVARFSETRRRHPLALDRPAGDGVARERELLGPLRRAAHLLIDTTGLSSNDLRRDVARRFASTDTRGLTLTAMSFGYARGIPRDADLVFDMRFLHNPHWNARLRPLTGSDPAVAAYVAADPLHDDALDAISALLLLLLPGYGREGRSYVTVAFGCTGGRHRSVAVVEAMAARLGAAGWKTAVAHRDRGEDPAAADELQDGGTFGG